MEVISITCVSFFLLRILSAPSYDSNWLTDDLQGTHEFPIFARLNRTFSETPSAFVTNMRLDTKESVIDELKTHDDLVFLVDCETASDITKDCGLRSVVLPELLTSYNAFMLNRNTFDKRLLSRFDEALIGMQTAVDRLETARGLYPYADKGKGKGKYISIRGGFYPYVMYEGQR